MHIKCSLEEKNKMCAEVLCQLPKANDESDCDLFSTTVYPHSPVIRVLIETSRSYFTYKVNITIQVSVTRTLRDSEYSNKAKRSFKGPCF